MGYGLCDSHNQDKEAGYGGGQCEMSIWGFNPRHIASR
jgi:hypothetical protein